MTSFPGYFFCAVNCRCRCYALRSVELFLTVVFNCCRYYHLQIPTAQTCPFLMDTLSLMDTFRVHLSSRTAWLRIGWLVGWTPFRTIRIGWLVGWTPTPEQQPVVWAHHPSDLLKPSTVALIASRVVTSFPPVDCTATSFNLRLGQVKGYGRPRMRECGLLRTHFDGGRPPPRASDGYAPRCSLKSAKIKSGISSASSESIELREPRSD